MVGSSANTEHAVATAGFYDQFWERYLWLYQDELPATDRARIEFICRCIERYTQPGHLRILDLGCGTGWMSPYLSQYGTVTGVDFSLVGIDHARDKFGGHGVFVLADAEDQRLGLRADQFFDVVVCSEVIEHVVDAYALLLQINDFLTKKGYCFLTTPNGNLWQRFSKEQPDQLQAAENWLTPRDLMHLVTRAGFVIKHRERMGSYKPRWPTRLLHRSKVERAFSALRLSRLHTLLTISSSFYQMMAVQKCQELTHR